MTWNDLVRVIPPNQVNTVQQFFDRLQPRPDSTLNLVKSLVAHMRTNGWKYTINAGGGLQNAITTRKINCDNLTDFIIFFCAYNNRPNNIQATRVQVHGVNSPVFIPQIKIIHAGLRIDMNVQGQVAGVFFSNGHRVASVNNVCFDLITGNKGSQITMHNAYVLCTKMPAPPADRFRFDYLAHTHYLNIQRGSTSQGLQKFTCT